MNVEEEVERLKEEIKRLGKAQDDGSIKRSLRERIRRRPLRQRQQRIGSDIGEDLIGLFDEVAVDGVSVGGGGKCLALFCAEHSPLSLISLE
ncbi:galactosyl transferase GMA12/MNN10 family protein [Actinidia rufa]|uniref:Galactosyl transferase GMA12/MNN10 family protein n=1 Tax=Actinidia rufa TaxID=165716 RepID=A0A7J0DEV0_9ERIC|nr:galactosyl transferase GMA12/MNN10 family protein [Actinidia rufa]